VRSTLDEKQTVSELPLPSCWGADAVNMACVGQDDRRGWSRRGTELRTIWVDSWPALVACCGALTPPCIAGCCGVGSAGASRCLTQAFVAAASAGCLPDHQRSHCCAGPPLVCVGVHLFLSIGRPQLAVLPDYKQNEFWYASCGHQSPRMLKTGWLLVKFIMYRNAD